MSSHYNPWPLGKLPTDWRRPEPDMVLAKGYQWADPRDINDIFAGKIAEYSGSRFAVLTDSCSNGLFLALQYKKMMGEISEGDSIVIPRRTYVSVPMAILHSGFKPRFEDLEWSGLYQLGKTGIYDSAARFTTGMFISGEKNLQVLSFQIKKRLPIGRGGAILTDDEKAYVWLKRAVYDGRDLNSEYTTVEHVNQIGWHFYMTPEDAARGILLLDQIPSENHDTMDWMHYPPLTDYRYFRDF